MIGSHGKLKTWASKRVLSLDTIVILVRGDSGQAGQMVGGGSEEGRGHHAQEQAECKIV